MGASTLKKRKREPEYPSHVKLEVVPDHGCPLSPPDSDNETEYRTSSVTFHRPSFWVALLKPAPGLQLPEGLEWDFLERDRESGEARYEGQNPDLELFMEATNDPVMDYVAREERDPSDPNRLTWYCTTDWEGDEGTTKAVLVTPMVVRGVVRTRKASEEAMSAPVAAKTYSEQKIELGQTFGTKKARKAIEARAMNDLRPQGIEGTADSTSMKLNDAEKATLEEIRKITSVMATKEELQAAIDEARPVPAANLEATEIADVYNPNVFIGAEVLAAVPILDWQQELQAHSEIKLSSRFVARRIERIGRQEQPVDKLRLLRYLYFLIRFYTCAKDGRRGSKVVPKKDQLAEAMEPAPSSVVEHIRRKFSDNGTISQFYVQLLMTHCCAIAAIIDNFETDVENLRQDLSIDSNSIKQYFAQIGARTTKLKKEGKGNHQVIAKLALPLQFPNMSRGGLAKRR